MDFVVLVLPVLDAAHIEGRPVREHQTVGCQPLVPRIEHGVKHGLVEEAVAHPLGDDDVHLVHSLGQADLRPVRPHPGDDIGPLVQLPFVSSQLGTYNFYGCVLRPKNRLDICQDRLAKNFSRDGMHAIFIDFGSIF